MTSFASLLSSISGQPASAPQSRPPTASRPPNGNVPARPQALSNGVGPANNAAAGVKRKAEDQAGPLNVKSVKIEGNNPVRTSGQTTSASKPAPSLSATAATYRGTARSSGTTNPAKSLAKSVPRPATNGATPAPAPASPAPTNAAAKPKGRFAALMERAKAAQAVVKAAGPSTIKHKPVDKANRREKARAQEDGKGKIAAKAGKAAITDRSRSNTPMDGKAGLQKKAMEPGYKGTMNKKPVVRQEFTYKGTMNKAGSGKPPPTQQNKHSSGRSKYDDYVDWDELSDAVDEQEDYESDESDMMDAGFDDMEREDAAALRAAKKEDQEALNEEERHRREKLERKRKLEALSKNAAARNKKY